jgi:Flp pilus assembly pilin Flp
MPDMFFAIQLAIEAMQRALNRLLDIKSEKGVITMEYGLLGVLIAVALIGSVQSIRDKVLDMLTTIINAFP